MKKTINNLAVIMIAITIFFVLAQMVRIEILSERRSVAIEGIQSTLSFNKTQWEAKELIIKNIQKDVDNLTEKLAALDKRLAGETISDKDFQKIAIWEYSVDSNRVDCTGVLLKMFGIDPAKFHGTYEEFIERMHRDDKVFVDQAITAAAKLGSDYDCKFRVIWDDGTVHKIHAKGRRVVYNSQITRMVGLCWEEKD